MQALEEKMSKFFLNLDIEKGFLTMTFLSFKS